MAVDESKALRAGTHIVQFYGGIHELLDGAGRYIAMALDREDIAVLVATASHWRSLRKHLKATGIDIQAARAQRQLVSLDAHETLEQIMVEGLPDKAKFASVVGSVIRDAANTGRPVRAYGEMVAVLWDAGNVQGAIELESLWNDLAATTPFSLYCAYPSSVDRGVITNICRLHSQIAAHTKAFDANLQSPREARWFVSRLLEAWDVGAGSAEDASLIVTELATNSVLHAGSRFTVSVSRPEAAVRIAVADSSDRLPAPRGASAVAGSGRGLTLVSELASSWGSEQVRGGKIVWAELQA